MFKPGFIFTVIARLQGAPSVGSGAHANPIGDTMSSTSRLLIAGPSSSTDESPPR